MVSIVKQEPQEILDFISKWGDGVYWGNEQSLPKYIDYYLGIRRIFILRNHVKHIMGIAAVTMHSTPPLTDEDSLKDDPNGTILVVHGIVVHGLLRHSSVMKFMLAKWVQLFPRIKMIMYRRHSKGGDWKVMPIEKILGTIRRKDEFRK